MRLYFARTAIAALTLTVLGDDVGAQELPRRSNVEAVVGVLNRVPGWGDEGIGPYLSATLRRAAGPSYRAFLLGVGYGIVFTDGWTSPDGVRYDYSPETVMLHLGFESPIGEKRRFALDAQWNPALSRIRRTGERPPWVHGNEPWEWSYSTVSFGLRYDLSGSRGPVVAVNLRTYISLLSPFFVLGHIPPWYVLGLSVRPR